MPLISPTRPTIAFHHDESFQRTVNLNYLRKVLKQYKVTIRFENNYGVAILPTAPLQTALEEYEELFAMLVLRFYGPGVNDYQMAQYAPIPELNHCNLEDVFKLCIQVALLPPSWVGTGKHKKETGNAIAVTPQNLSNFRACPCLSPIIVSQDSPEK
jgi:hypothetical protein